MQDIAMYFDKNIAKDFAEHEQNEKNFKVAEIIDQVILKTIGAIDDTFKACELGGGAHPDRYHEFFEKLMQANGKIDWVDVSPYMLELAKTYIDTDEYKNRLPVISFIESDIIQYLRDQEDDSLDLAIMKYTIDHIADLDVLFALLQRKLKPHGALVSSIGVLTPQLKSISTNARFLHNGEEFPLSETRQLHDGDSFTVKFFAISGNPDAGYIPGAETTKYYHSEEQYRMLAEKYAFDTYLGDWKGYIMPKIYDMDQDVLVLRKE